ncbi:hypothetical protein FE263_11385 [Lichenicoccus roseus]|uniref:Glycosyltransferase RgtA/B/C/D-like domain-containing protein n=1 Tax=Lichenicoccus roseus TaxID=2683649 RepID=A0A5R9J4T4_9PROT|nr:hypothetical protein FE263_11385 [Lichenicoccus roseus]
MEHRSALAVPRFRLKPASGPLTDLGLGLLVVLAGLVTRLYGLGDKPYWLDEVTTLHRSALPARAMIRDSLSFHHLPLYFLISGWFIPHGTDEATLRLPAALFGAVSCLLLFGLTRTLGGRRAALGAGLLLALSPFQVQYGQEARSYTLVISFILLGLWALVVALREPSRAALPLHRAGSAWRAWLVYGLATTAALDTLSVALFWLAAGLIALLAAAWRDAAARRGLLVNVAIVHAAVLACYLPWIVAMHRLTKGDMGSGLDWVPPLNWERLWTTIQAVYLLRTTSLIAFHTFPDGVAWLGGMVCALALFGLWRVPRRQPAMTAAKIALVTLPAGLLVASLVSSVWMPRYLAWSGPIFFLFAGLGLGCLPRNLSFGVLAVMIVAGVANLLPYYRLETKPLWNDAAMMLRGSLPADALLLTDDPGAIDMMNVRLQRLADPFPDELWTDDATRALQSLHDGHPVLAVHGRVGQADHTPLSAFLDMVAPLGAPCMTRTVGLDIIIEAFTPDGRPCPTTPETGGA